MNALKNTLLTEVSLPLSSDVGDLLAVAKKWSAKMGHAQCTDRHVLMVMLRHSRLFTLIDTLFKCSGVAPQKLLKSCQEKMLEPLPAVSTLNSLLERAAAEATIDQKSKIHPEHLLLALANASDPMVRGLFNSVGLTREKLQLHYHQIQENRHWRLLKFWTREVAEVLVVVLITVILVKQFLGELRLIPSESMLPTLQVGDRIVVERLSHWFQYRPQRGDILVFFPPEPESFLPQDPFGILLRWTGFSSLLYGKDSVTDRAFIKRAIGLPGDTLDVRPGQGVFINGVKLDEPYVSEVAYTCTQKDSCGPIKVPPHMYFMMGDNRNHSHDSRYWSFLPEDRILGRAVFRYWPLDNRFGKL